MIIRRFAVVERSMAPTLEPGDHILTIRRPPTEGVVVVADAPDGLRVVKRVVAVGPAEVAASDDTLLVDGSPSPWTPPGGMSGSGSWTVAPGSVFLLSDAAHRTDADSRSWGAVAADRVVGVVGWRYRPIRRAGRIRSESTR